jgi:hypothetical protein
VISIPAPREPNHHAARLKLAPVQAGRGLVNSIKPIVEEYVLHSLDCSCGVRTTATLPDGVPTGAFGPSVVAMAATLMHTSPSR